MGEFWKSKRFKILLGVLVLLLAMMLQAAWNGGVPPVLAQAVGVVVTPVQRAAAFISDGVTSHLRRYLAADQLAQENQQLHNELRQLREQMVDYERYKRESETLRDYLGIREEHEDLELLPAAVVARDPNSRFGSFTIDKGTLAGVEPLDPVISADGLVGLVREAGPNYAKVLTILDVEIDAGAKVLRTQELGTISGDVELAGQGCCKLSYLDRESAAAAGDLVYTSGGALFPADLVVGSILRVEDEREGISRFAVVRPAAQIPELTDVMVITSFNGQGVQADE